MVLEAKGRLGKMVISTLLLRLLLLPWVLIKRFVHMSMLCNGIAELIYLKKTISVVDINTILLAYPQQSMSLNMVRCC
jgi:hypothetical protein